MLRILFAIFLLLVPAYSDAFQLIKPRAAGGSSEFCTGTEAFCTSWETGSDALNTGASGNEDVWETSWGSPTRGLVSGDEGDYGLILNESNEGVSTTNGGSYFGSSAWVTGQFIVMSNNMSVEATSSITYLYNNSSYTVISLRLEEDDGDYDTTMRIGVVAQKTSGTTNTIGTAQTITMGDVYYYKMFWGSGTVTRWKLYDSSKTLLYDSGDVAITRSNTLNSLQSNISSTTVVHQSAVKVTSYEPTL